MSEPAIPAKDFPRFSELPVELREEIWLYCLPPRVVELSWPVDDIVFRIPGTPWENDKWPCELYHTSRMNRVPPLITKVCHESRRVAFKNGRFASGPNSLPQDTQQILVPQWAPADNAERWISFKQDTVHMSWTSTDTARCGYDRSFDIETLPYLAWHASFYPNGGSIMIDHLGWRYFSPRPWLGWQANHGGPFGLPLAAPAGLPLPPNKQSDLDALSKLSTCQVVMRVVVVHADAKAAGETGLFGLLADARVQIVDVADTVRLAAFMNFAEACEREKPAIVPQDFSFEVMAKVNAMMRGVALTEFASEGLAARMRPAIMFRLCTRACNHVGYDPRYNTGTWLGLLGHYPGGYGRDRGMLGYRRGEGRRAQSRRQGGSRWDHEWRPLRGRAE